MKKMNSRYMIYMIIGLILAALPLLGQMGILGGWIISTVGFVIIYAIAALGLNVLLGYSGLVSLGTAGFMGVAAYLTMHFTVTVGLSFWFALPIIIIILTLLGLLVGLVSLRLAGMSLAIATLAVSEVLRRIIIDTWGFMPHHLQRPDIFVRFLERDGTFWLIVIFLVVLMILTDNFIHSPIGRAFLTMRISEPAAQAMGINLLKYKLMAFGIATAYASLAGILYAHLLTSVGPEPWTVMLSLQIVAIIVIGGFKTITGAIVGSFIVFGVPRLVLNQLPDLFGVNPVTTFLSSAGVPLILNGLLIIAVILFYPRGLIYVGHDLKRLYKRLSKKKEVKSS